MPTLAPGARVVVRDAEWLVRSIKCSENGAQAFEAIGLSHFIKGKRRQFIADLETDLTVLDPKETALVLDDSPGFRRSLLFIEAHLRQTAPTDGCLYVGHQGAMDALDFQLAPALKALQTPRQRLLIADAVGLGKTLEAGILIAELIRRGRARRILAVTTKSMLSQFQKEFWTRFTIPLTRLDSLGIQRIRSRIPANHNPFHYYDKAIISIDTLKQDREYRAYIEQAYWDVILIDECHNVARRGQGQSASLRARLAARLSTRSDALILLSATPHDGRPESFASLMNMLDPTAIANESNYTKEDIRDLYVRRFKKDVAHQLAQRLPERRALAVEAPASPAEEEAFERLSRIALAGTNEKRQAGLLFKTFLLKSLLSSPMACSQTLQTRIRNLEALKNPAFGADLAELRELLAAVGAVDKEDFSKYQTLLKLITQTDGAGFGWDGRNPQDRLVIFTERLETMKFLASHLGPDLALPAEAVVTLRGGMADVEQMAVIERFGNEKEPLRVLVATDVASEGINLHYLSYRLVHFDIPWSLMALQQRNGRIDRYGQEQQPQIRYLLSRSRHPRMGEAERIIQTLLKKDEQAALNIGDPSAFMGVFDVDEEARITAMAIERGDSAEDFERRLAPPAGEEEDFFAFLDWDSDGAPDAEAQSVKQWPSLFASDFQYAACALEAVAATTELQIHSAPEAETIQLTPPEELRRRYERLPSEILPPSGQPLTLCADKRRIARAWEAARRSEVSWPSLQYLWPLHPVLEWLGDRCMTHFGRHQAPILTLPQGLGPREAVFILTGVIPNRRGHPLINRWLSAVFEGGEFRRVEDFEETLERTRLGKQPIPNSLGTAPESLLELRAVAVEQAVQVLLAERRAFMERIEPELAQQRQRLDALWEGHARQLELRFGDGADSGSVAQSRKDREKNRIDRIFEDQRRWVEESLTTEPAPYIKIIAALRGESG
ncbi:MAG: ATP-dependent helicase [Cyanobacteria bacterium RI_101]|nr:ATP-dependent helicase [Cyanobacteria bacterium RI_101]